jgi:hypothetical protein
MIKPRLMGVKLHEEHFSDGAVDSCPPNTFGLGNVINNF